MIPASTPLPYLPLAGIAITLALLCYTVGVWGEWYQRRLRRWHIVFFVLGLCADATGTALMRPLARSGGDMHGQIHSVTGLAAIVLMLIHTLWAIWIYAKGSENAKRRFNRFSILVWCLWLIPYLGGIFIGMRNH
ncbi:HsmA family protein [Rikenella microfusus]|uniref:HsmA family protein n=1 Tax=Rikenella microfusus TaxID=28139 RepID=UPI00248DB8E0|nr:HsmA family protein [Rikenella microfusus]